MEKITCLFAFLCIFKIVIAQQVDSREVRCLVCKATVQEMEKAIGKEDPNKMTPVGSFRMDATGNSIHKQVKYVTSETYLTDLMENICDRMDDYVKAVHKKKRNLILMKLIENGKMNTFSSEVDFVQDGDLNKSLKHYCLEILEDKETVFMNAFMKDEIESYLDIRICSERAKYCNDEPVQEEYKLEDEEEFKDEL